MFQNRAKCKLMQFKFVGKIVISFFCCCLVGWNTNIEYIDVNVNALHCYRTLFIDN